eukprot:4675903-Pleurochrysis_carterae.AAC.6
MSIEHMCDFSWACAFAVSSRGKMARNHAGDGAHARKSAEGKEWRWMDEVHARDPLIGECERCCTQEAKERSTFASATLDVCR